MKGRGLLVTRRVRRMVVTGADLIAEIARSSKKTPHGEAEERRAKKTAKSRPDLAAAAE